MHTLYSVDVTMETACLCSRQPNLIKHFRATAHLPFPVDNLTCKALYISTDLVSVYTHLHVHCTYKGLTQVAICMVALMASLIQPSNTVLGAP